MQKANGDRLDLFGTERLENVVDLSDVEWRVDFCPVRHAFGDFTPEIARHERNGFYKP